MRVETHCHSEYSFDSGLEIKNIVEQCVKIRLEGIVICDHDVCGITENDEKLFDDNGIKLFKAIEFTTSEGAHIIGISDHIEAFNWEKGKCTSRELVDILKKTGATIIIPHPDHATGIRGNGKISETDIDYILSKSNYIEILNYKYGKTDSISEIKSKYPNLECLVGSDAHAMRDVGAVYNILNTNNIISISDKKVVEGYVYRKKNYGRKPIIRKIKSGVLYQVLLRLIPERLRRKIKNKYINR